MSVRAPVWPVNINNFDKICIWRWLCAIRSNDKIITDFLFYYLKNIESNISWNNGAIFESINREQVWNIEIYLPKIEEQKNIIQEVETYEKEIEKAKQIMASCFSRKQAVLDKYLK